MVAGGARLAKTVLNLALRVEKVLNLLSKFNNIISLHECWLTR